MKIKRISTIIVDIPLKRPHVMSLMTVEKMNFLLVRIEGSNGIEGWGEAAFLGGPTWSEEGVESAQAIVETYIGPYLVGKDFTCIEALRQLMEKLVRGNHFALAAVEMALFDLLGKTRNLPVFEMLGGMVQDKVPLSWSLASGTLDAELREAEKMRETGGFIFKLKTGLLRPEKDIERVKNIRRALGEDVRLRIDANQGWDRFTAIKAIRGMEDFNLDFAEQPVSRNDIDSLAAVAKSVNVPLLADESLGSLQDAVQLIKRDAVGMFGIKLTKAGGFLGGKRLAAIAEGANFPCYVGCMIETGIGNAAYLHFAVSTPAVTLGCELFGPLLLADTITEEETSYRDGHIVLENQKPGLGITVNEAQIRKYQR
jgi:muconate cycloisomerase